MVSLASDPELQKNTLPCLNGETSINLSDNLSVSSDKRPNNEWYPGNFSYCFFATSINPGWSKPAQTFHRPELASKYLLFLVYFLYNLD